LEIQTSAGRPLPFAASDIGTSVTKYALHKAFYPVANLNAQGSQQVWNQVATMTRLRSIVLANPSATDILPMIDRAQSSIPVSARKSRPAWWTNTEPPETLVRCDSFIVERVLNVGFTQIVNDIHIVFPPVNKASLEERVSLLTVELHQLQVAMDQRRMLDDNVVMRLSSLRGTTLLGQAAMNSFLSQISARSLDESVLAAQWNPSAAGALPPNVKRF
jgi:hypothetical protein